MQSGVQFLVNVLLCLIICTCKGAPPEHERLKVQAKYRFTEIEDKFIFDEISNFFDGRTPVFTRDVWYEIAKKHNEKWKAYTRGFPQERSSISLRSRFRDIIKQRNQSSTVEVPGTLMQKIRQEQPHLLEQGRTFKNTYSEKENDVIIEELRKPSLTKFYGKVTFEAIRDALEGKRLANTEGFEIERNVRSIRGQLSKLKQMGSLPKEVLQKFQLPQEESHLPDATGASSSTSTTQNQQVDLQETINVEQEDEENEDEDIYGAIIDDPIIVNTKAVNEGNEGQGKREEYPCCVAVRCVWHSTRQDRCLRQSDRLHTAPRYLPARRLGGPHQCDLNSFSDN